MNVFVFIRGSLKPRYETPILPLGILSDWVPNIDRIVLGRNMSDVELILKTALAGIQRKTRTNSAGKNTSQNVKKNQIVKVLFLSVCRSRTKKLIFIY